MADLYEIEVEPEVRSWLEGLTDRDSGRVDFLVGLLSERAGTPVSRTPVTSVAKSASCGSICCASRPE